MKDADVFLKNMKRPERETKKDDKKFRPDEQSEMISSGYVDIIVVCKNGLGVCYLLVCSAFDICALYLNNVFAGQWHIPIKNISAFHMYTIHLAYTKKY